MYTIRITYGTGDSFHNSHGNVSDVGAVWEDLEEARVALKYINEHHSACSDYNWRRPRVPEHYKKFKHKPWYDKDCKKDWDFCYTLMVPVNGVSTKISAFWHGYFETLEMAEIVLTEDNRDCIRF